MYIVYFVSCVNVYMLVVAILLCTRKHQSVSLLLLFYFFKEIIWGKIRRVWRYQRGNQNPHIEEEQTTEWPKQKKYKRTNNDLQNIHIQLKIEWH